MAVTAECQGKIFSIIPSIIFVIGISEAFLYLLKIAVSFLKSSFLNNFNIIKNIDLTSITSFSSKFIVYIFISLFVQFILKIPGMF